MKFKSLNDFVNENKTQIQPINENKEKFKISGAKTTNKQGEAAFVVKYIGAEFDQQMLEVFMAKDPIAGPALQKVKSNPKQYFFIFRTLNPGESRFLAPNTKKWATYLELINAMSEDGKMIYINFDKPPYNNFVKWTEAEKLINKQDPEVITTAKQIVGSVDNSGTQQAQQAMTDIEKSVAANAQQFQKTGQIPGQQGGTTPGTTTTQPQAKKDASSLMDSLMGIGLGSRGPKVDLLQRTIQALSQENADQNVELEAEKSLKKSGQFDDIYRVHTDKSLQLLLGLDAPPGKIDANIIAGLKDLLQRHPEITAEQLLSKDPIDIRLSTEPEQPIKPKQPAQPKSPVQPQPTQPTSQNQPPINTFAATNHEIQTNKGKIKF